MTGPWRAIETTSGSIVVVSVDEADPSAAVLDVLDRALESSGLDALASWAPATDAIVRTLGGRVVEHLERRRLGRLDLPQIVSADAWNRFRSAHDVADDALPATVLACDDGRVGVLDGALLDGT